MTNRITVPPGAPVTVRQPAATAQSGSVQPLAGTFQRLPASKFGVAPIPPRSLAITAFLEGSRPVLNIYEQFPGKKEVFTKVGTNPTVVDPTLRTFDFTGQGARYLDSNGFSARIGNKDLGSKYRLTVERDTEQPGYRLVARPTWGASGPDLVVARTRGEGAPGKNLELMLEPGWAAVRQTYEGKPKGHIYLQHD